jgi:hypothetical protein
MTIAAIPRRQWRTTATDRSCFLLFYFWMKLAGFGAQEGTPKTQTSDAPQISTYFNKRSNDNRSDTDLCLYQ